MINKELEDLKDSFKVIHVPAELDLTIEKAIQTGKRLKRKNRIYKYLTSAACLAFVFMSSLMLFKHNAFMINSEHNPNFAAKSSQQDNSNQAEEIKLPIVGNFENLEMLVGSTYPKNEYWTNSEELGLSNSMKKESASIKTGMSDLSNNIGGNSDYSKTNTQVEGVDEADRVKTDGDYIYKIYNFTNTGNMDWGVQVIKALPAENMSLVKQISLTEINPIQLFVKDNYLIVLGSLYKGYPVTTQKKEAVNSSISSDKIGFGMFSTIAYIYDIKDKNNINLVRSIELDGSYTSSRMIESNLYLISNKYINRSWLEDNENKERVLPFYKDSILGADPVILTLDKINYLPEALEPTYILIASLNLDKINDQLNVSCSLGSGRNIFCSTDNLYVAGYNFRGDNQFNTTIYKFNLKDKNVNLIAKGVVNGSILNQYSMDEYKDTFRITTTINPNGGNVLVESQNNLYVLGKDMKPLGKVEGLAKGEKIYSTRFMGDRAYMVTFKQTDPLFVIDLRNPMEPKVLGELKIPGFSNYLHPYDENHILGFGMDTVTVNSVKGEIVQQKGMKIALFDVTEVNNPKEQFSVKIGDSGTYSELLNDPKALLFSKEKNLLAFPVTVTEVKNDYRGVPVSNTVFKGAYVYNFDLTNGFRLKGQITHMTTQDMRSKEYNWHGDISRVLYIKDNLYTVSDSMIKVNNIADIKALSSLKLK